MRAMKDSGIEWIGAIPQNWELRKIKTNFDIIAGATPKSGEASYWDGDIPWITPADYTTEGIYVSAGHKSITQDGLNSCATSLIPEGSIIFSKRAPVGLVAINSNPLCTNQGCLSCVPKESVDAKYYYYVMSIYGEQFDLFASGTTFKEISADAFANFKLPYPDFETQKQIASFLDTKCAEIDALIAAKEKTNALLKERRQSIIYEAVTKGLDPSAPMKDSGVEWIGEIPKGWETIRAKYVASISNGSDPKEEGDIPVYGSGSDSFRTCGEYKEGPAVLIGRKGATLHIPHYVEGKYWNVDTAFDVKTEESKYLLKYYYYASICFDYKLYISTTTLPSMTQTNYGNMFLPLPSVEVQREIIDYIEEALRTIDSLIATNEIAGQKLKEYRQSLIYEAVTGKIEV